MTNLNELEKQFYIKEDIIQVNGKTALGMEKEKYMIKITKKYMKVILLMITMRVMGNIIMKMVDIIQVGGREVLKMEKEKIIIKMEKLNMKVILLIINMKEKENFIMKMTNIIQVNGKKI